MDNPKISVLVPLYNRRHYIAQCLDSALNQTFKGDYEIIVRDDGSTDGSADFVEQRYATAIASGKLKLRRNEKNIGEFPTYNKRLIPEARGKYLMFLSSDDMYLPRALEHMYEVAEHFNADVVHESFYFTTAPDGVIKDEKSLILTPTTFIPSIMLRLCLTTRFSDSTSGIPTKLALMLIIIYSTENFLWKTTCVLNHSVATGS